jgi:regulator of nonsense transcripts 3
MAVVEFAPYQKVPPEKKKADPRINTIEAGACISKSYSCISLTLCTDEDYISFLNSLSADPGKLTDANMLEAYRALLVLHSVYLLALSYPSRPTGPEQRA